VSLPDFRKQSVSLIALAVLDQAVGKYCGNKEHKYFYVENLEPNQGKKLRPTPCRIFTQFTNGQKRLQGNTHCYKVTHVTSLLLDLVTHHVQRHLDKRILSPQDKLHDTPF